MKIVSINKLKNLYRGKNNTKKTHSHIISTQHMSKRITITRERKGGVAASAAPRRETKDKLKETDYETSEEVVICPTFESMGLRPDLLKGIYGYGKNNKYNMHASLTRSYTHKKK